MSELPSGWEVKRLRECSIANPEYGANSASIAYDINLPRYIRITDITDSGRLNPDNQVSVELKGNEQYLLKDKDFLFARSGATVGKTYRYREADGWCLFAGYLIRFRLDEDVLLTDYLEQYTNTHRYNYWVQSTLRAGAQPNINAKEYGSMQIPLPPLAEQRAIATILSTWDEAIALTDALIAALQARKNGLMQKLLTGEVRFPEFDGAWDKKPLHYLTKKRQGLKRGPFGGALKKAYFVPSGYKVYQQKNAIYQDLTLGNYYIDEDKFDELRAFEVLLDDFIVSCSGTIGKIARISATAEAGVINQALLRIRLESTRIDHDFFQFQFEAEPMQRLIIDNTHGGAMQNLVPMTVFRITPFVLPTIQEQRKIAEVLRTSDQLIAGLQEYIEHLQQQKKGLMQQLLTGQVRVDTAP